MQRSFSTHRLVVRHGGELVKIQSLRPAPPDLTDNFDADTDIFLGLTCLGDLSTNAIVRRQA